MTDPTALQERIARALTEHWKRKHSTLLASGPCSGCSRVAADAVAAEVRAAQADAWDRAVRSLSYPDGSPVEVLSNPNPYREQED